MDKGIFSTLDDEALGSICAETIIEVYKETGSQGGDFHTEIFSELNQGQQALFLFRIYYQHAAKTADDFHWWTAYFLPQSNLWSGIKNALRFFGDTGLLQVLDDIEEQVKRKFQPDRTQALDVTSTELYTEAELQPLFAQSHAAFQQRVPAALSKIASYIRNHPEKFVEWT